MNTPKKVLDSSLPAETKEIQSTSSDIHNTLLFREELTSLLSQYTALLGNNTPFLPTEQEIEKYQNFFDQINPPIKKKFDLFFGGPTFKAEHRELIFYFLYTFLRHHSNTTLFQRGIAAYKDIHTSKLRTPKISLIEIVREVLHFYNSFSTISHDSPITKFSFWKDIIEYFSSPYERESRELLFTTLLFIGNTFKRVKSSEIINQLLCAYAEYGGMSLEEYIFYISQLKDSPSEKYINNEKNLKSCRKKLFYLARSKNYELNSIIELYNYVYNEFHKNDVEKHAWVQFITNFIQTLKKDYQQNPSLPRPSTLINDLECHYKEENENIAFTLRRIATPLLTRP